MTRIVIAMAAIAAAIAPLLLTDQTFFVQTALTALVVTGLSLFMGYAGQASLGQGAFVAVGGLTVAVGTVTLGIPPLVALVAAPVLGALVAALVGWPLLRLRGHYLAFGSLAVLLIIQTVMATAPLFGAGVGIFGIPPLSVGGLVVTDQRVYSYVALAALAAALLVCHNLVRSRFGRGIRALAGSESAAASSGVPILRSKLTVFAVAGGFAGFAGALGAFFTPYVSQDTYPPFVSFGYVVMAVVGGLGSVWGGVVGTLALSLWLQVLSALSATPGMPAAAGPILQYAGYGIVLVVFLLFVPRGIVPTLAGLRARRHGVPAGARAPLTPTAVASAPRGTAHDRAG
ncbi:branched-chain amino acid ABC transporter permease [Microbacterium sp. Kw_RZR3]|jgi:branched-chain amino acid transport system permease protein|uniref:branched-chain amino acid ABC transporter permease n=1 Tax=unclassified Microbacterium TaxID=2609290 RepID=UPI0023DCAAB2|nr:branched-chain amino acid ABC transporter permease [Microbacterium sp. Kw_RZR3]MDF2046933.1 branched-chain amino acid ABC transporter permease [Microbacterium sp. Kw_RZR3]